MNMSAGTFSDANRVDADPYSYRSFFRRRWHAFIIENFRTAEEIRSAFKVDRTTAENWLAGRNAPQGWAVGHAMTDPELGPKAQKHLMRSSPCEVYAAE